MEMKTEIHSAQNPLVAQPNPKEKVPLPTPTQSPFSTTQTHFPDHSFHAPSLSYKKHTHTFDLPNLKLHDLSI